MKEKQKLFIGYTKHGMRKWKITNNRFVVFLDIMGFKDLVMRNSHNDVYKTLTKLSDTKNQIDALFSSSKGLIPREIYTTNFSDSFVLFSNDDSAESFRAIANATGFLFYSAMSEAIPMKGAIACGTISVDLRKQVYFGQPLIDAYMLQEDVNYYGIVCHNSIDNYFNTKTEHKEIRDNFFETKTPLKSGHINHYNYNWFAFFRRLLVADADNELFKKDFYEVMDKIKLITSGSPRRYIDNTIAIFESMLKLTAANRSIANIGAEGIIPS